MSFLEVGEQATAAPSGPVLFAQAPQLEVVPLSELDELWLPDAAGGKAHSAAELEPAAVAAPITCGRGKRKRSKPKPESEPESEPQSEPESHAVDSAGDRLDPLIEKVREDAPLLSCMESVEALQLEFLSDADTLLCFLASRICKADNQPLDTHMFVRCFERILRTKAFLENCAA